MLASSEESPHSASNTSVITPRSWKSKAPQWKLKGKLLELLVELNRLITTLWNHSEAQKILNSRIQPPRWRWGPEQTVPQAEFSWNVVDVKINDCKLPWVLSWKRGISQQSHSEQFSCVYFDFFKQIRPKYWGWEQNVECYKPRWWLLNAGVVNCAEQEPRLTFPTVTEWPKTRAATSPSGSARVYIVTDRTSWRPTWGNSGTRRLETRSPPKLRRVGPKLEIREKSEQYRNWEVKKKKNKPEQYRNWEVLFSPLLEA